jgi:hypothetical protein
MRLFRTAAIAVLCAGPAYLLLQGQVQRIPAYFESEAAAKPFPATENPKSFTDPNVRRAYEVAREIPGVLAQQPCYCYCDRAGHKGLLSCHRDAHSSHCGICIKEALLASRLTKAGKKPAEIRQAIIRGDWQYEALK